MLYPSDGGGGGGGRDVCGGDLAVEPVVATVDDPDVGVFERLLEAADVLPCDRLLDDDLDPVVVFGPERVIVEAQDFPGGDVVQQGRPRLVVVALVIGPVDRVTEAQALVLIDGDHAEGILSAAVPLVHLDVAPDGPAPAG